MDFSKQLQKAEEAVRRRNYDFAVDLYRQLLDIEPDLGEARAGLRGALRKRFEQKRSSKLLRAVGGAVPLGRAKTLRRLGRHDACARALEDYLRSNPLDEEANLLLGMALEDAEHFQSARAVYEFVAEIAPRNAEGLKRAGAMLYRTGDHRKALDCYERALAIDPRDQEAMKARKNLSAEAALSTTDLDAAGHSRERIADQEEARRLDRAGRSRLSDEDLADEIARMEERFAESPSDPDVMVRLAALHERKRDWEAAIELYERARQYRRDSYELACKLGDVKSRVLKKRIAKAGGEGDEALAGRLEEELAEHELADFARRAELRPTDHGVQLELGKRHLRRGAYDEAATHLQAAVGDPRLGADALFLLGRCFHEKGYPDLARKQYERALDSRPGMDERAKEILYNLGLVAEQQEDREGARGYFVRIFEVDIGYRDVAAKMESL